MADAATPPQRDDWPTLTDRLTVDHQGYDTTIEVLDPEGGDNTMVERLPFDSIIFDPKADVIVLSVGGNSPRYPVVLRHLISHPQELVFDHIPQGAALKITDAAGTTTLVSLLRREPGA